MRRAVWLALAVVPLLVPVGFASPGPALTYVYLATCGLAALAAPAWMPRLGTAGVAVFGLLAVGVVTTLAQGAAVPALLLFGQAAAGVCLGLGLVGMVSLVWAYTGVLVASLVVDWVTTSHLYLELFPAAYVDLAVDADRFRASGIIGQAVPAAFVLTACGTYLWVVHGSRRQYLRQLLAGVAVALGITLTGTRSALVVLAIVVVVYWGSAVVAGQPSRGVRWSPVAAAAVIAAPFVSFLAASGGLGSEVRLIDFSGLEGSQSLEVRRSALSTVANLPDPCGGVCVAVGHGIGSLQVALRGTGRAVDGITTVDNQFVASFWETGVVGLVLLAVVVAVAVRALLDVERPETRAAGAALVATAACGLFVSELAINVCVIWLFAWLTLAARPSPVSGPGGSTRSTDPDRAADTSTPTPRAGAPTAVGAPGARSPRTRTTS